MQLIQFNIYFNNYLHTFMINGINYIVHACMCIENNQIRFTYVKLDSYSDGKPRVL